MPVICLLFGVRLGFRGREAPRGGVYMEGLFLPLGHLEPKTPFGLPAIGGWGWITGLVGFNIH